MTGNRTDKLNVWVTKELSSTIKAIAVISNLNSYNDACNEAITIGADLITKSFTNEQKELFERIKRNWEE